MRSKVVALPFIALLLWGSLLGQNPDDRAKTLRNKIIAEFGQKLPRLPVPEANPQSPEKIRLGEALFFDPNLSSCGSVACATCHIPEGGFSDGLKISKGCGGATGRRNSNTVYNTAYLSHLFWDGRAQSLEEQALGPVVDPAEMANTWDRVIEYLKTGTHPVSRKEFPAARQYYRQAFEKVFEGEVTTTTVSRAIAAYERTAVSFDSPYDQWLAGDDQALTRPQKRGLLVFFGPGGCVDCHAPPNFTDSDFHNIGVPNAGFEAGPMFPRNSAICGGIAKDADPGRAEVGSLSSSCSDLGKFKTPTLRNVALSGPYMHNGVFPTLLEAVGHYDRVARGIVPPVVGELDPDVTSILFGWGGGSPDEVGDVIEFLKALTGTQLKSPPQGIAPPGGGSR